MNIVCSIEGNIGSGKSTLLRYLQSNKFSKNIIFLKEPVDEWNTITDNEGKTILEHFYECKTGYSFQFQMMAYISRLVSLKNALKNNINSIIVTERCILTDKYVFEKMLYDDGFINEIEHKIYLKWFSEFEDITMVHKLIYLTTHTSIALDRIKKRNRVGEKDIKLDYLEKCNKYHNDWIMQFKTKTLILDGNPTIESDVLHFDKLTTSICKFLNIEVDATEDAKWLTAC